MPKTLDIHKETLPHKNNVSKPQQITVFLKFIETEKLLQLKHPEKSPERTNGSVYQCTRQQDKIEGDETLTEFKKIVERNAGYCKKELKTIKINQSKWTV